MMGDGDIIETSIVQTGSDEKIEPSLVQTNGKALPTFEEQQDEIKRRLGVILDRHDSGECATTVGFQGSKGGKGTHYPFKRDDQVYLVFSTSHIGVPPIAPSPDFAGFRVYGTFETQVDAFTYATDFAAQDSECNVQIAKMQDWVLAVSHLDKVENVDYTTNKTEMILAQHLQGLKESEADFRNYVENPDENRLPEKSDNAPSATKNATVDNVISSEKEIYKTRLSRNMEVRGQNFAVVSYVKDKLVESTEEEFIFNVWGCFEDEEECDGWIRDVASVEVTDHAMHVVSMYSWVQPIQMENSKATIPVHYRTEELDAIMKHANQHTKDLKDFKKWCADEKIETPVLEI